MKKRTSKIIRRVRGRDFYCLPDQSAPDLDIAALEKRRCNAILAKFCKFNRALDAFAGVGVSSRYWSACTKELFLVEKRPAALELLYKNLSSIRRRDCQVHLVEGTAQQFLSEAICQGWQFELVDCDPFGACYELLPLVAQVVRRGVICITSGEIFQVYRGLNRRFGRPLADGFRGRRVSGWVTQVLIPELISICGDAKLVHFYAYPTSVRVILSVGGFPIDCEKFNRRPHWLGWLAGAEVESAQQGQILDSARNAD